MNLRISEEIARALAHMLHHVMGNMCSRLQECLHKGGGEPEDTVFKQ